MLGSNLTGTTLFPPSSDAFHRQATLLLSESGERPASSQNPVAGASPPSSGASRRLSRPCHSGLQQLTLDSHGTQETKPGPLLVGGGSVGDRMMPSPPSGSLCPKVVFALSPSGRVFTLAMRRGATVLDAKAQIEGFEGVSPYRQRLLWRGVSMEPDSAPLHALGVRSGDTLIVGYKLALLSGVTTPAAEQERNAGDDSLVTGEAGNQKRYASDDESHVPRSGTSNGSEISASDSTRAAPAPADTRARNDGVDVTGGGSGGGGNGGGGGGDRAPILPSGSAAGQGTEKAAVRRRAWWSRKKSHDMRVPGDSDEQGRDDGSGDEGLEAAGVVVPPSASSSIAFSPDSMSARRARVAPAPEEPARPNASTGTASAGRTNLAGWARWGRRMPAFPVFADGGGGGRG